MEHARGHSRVPSLKARGWIIVSGALASLAIVIAAAIVLDPLTATGSELRTVARDGVPAQRQLVTLRTTVIDWQFFIERQLDALRPGVAPEPTELVRGGQLAATQAAQAKVMSRILRRIGMPADARELDEAMGSFAEALDTLTPVATGKPVDGVTLTALVDAERTTLERVWSVTTQIGKHLSQQVTDLETDRATGHLELGQWLFLGGAAIDLLIVVVATAILGSRAGRREREHRAVESRHAYEARVQEALEMTKTEPDVYDILGEALHESVPELQAEMLIADSSHAHFRRALTNGEEFEGCSVVSPLDCPAATVGHSLVFPSSRALNACPYLKSRPSGDCSAVCLPVSIAGRTVGVTHATGVDMEPPTESEVGTLNFTSRRGSERIAMIRAFTTSETQAQTDPLTGLLNRRSLQNAVRDLRSAGVPYALAYGDLDHFKILNDTHGHEAGDQALRLFARVLGDSLRPDDIAARYGGEEFVIVLPNCDISAATAVLERVRESLALSLRAGRVPPFTVTFGLASSAYAADFEEIVAIADRALLEAKAAGRNRVAVADVNTRDPQPAP